MPPGRCLLLLGLCAALLGCRPRGGGDPEDPEPRGRATGGASGTATGSTAATTSVSPNPSTSTNTGTATGTATGTGTGTMAESPYLYALHDEGGEHLFLNRGVTGWVVIAEGVGSDPQDRSGHDFRALAARGAVPIVRLDHGWGMTSGTLPEPSRYAAFAQRVAHFVSASPGCAHWIIGNETNMALWRPGGPSGPPILPSDYARVFKLCRDAIRAMPGHGQDRVITQATAPWNAQTGYWLDYHEEVLRRLGPGGCDGIAIHTYTHGPELWRVTRDELAPGGAGPTWPQYPDAHFDFLSYRDFMRRIPQTMRHLPVYCTETDMDVAWPDRDTGWIQAAYAEIDRWNHTPGQQRIRCLALYRWRNFDLFGMESKQALHADFAAAVGRQYRWDR